MDRTIKIAIVGGGPRSVAMVEQIIMLASEGNSAVSVDIFDKQLPGAGRIWHPKQNKNLLMNTHMRETTIFSGGPDSGPTRAGSGPSLQQWVQDRKIEIESGGYAPRYIYGEYLLDSLDKITASSPESVNIRPIIAHIVDVKTNGSEFDVIDEHGNCRNYHSVVIATGHTNRSRTSVVNNTQGRIIPGDSAADMQLDHISPEESVATIGLGLSFHDVVALLTSGRGGRFVATEGATRYIPSGDEPKIIGLSRSGLPIPSRGKNQKPSDYSFMPRLCTADRLYGLRTAEGADFEIEVEPWVRAEAEVTFVCTSLEKMGRGEDIERFEKEVSLISANPLESVRSISASYGIDVNIPSLYAMAHPFSGKVFDTFSQWDRTVREHISTDIDMAEEGNVSGPFKAALDTLRDLRPSIREIVENGGLTPSSHDDYFLKKWTPAYSLMVAGPPMMRNRELLALMDSGVVSIAAPNTGITARNVGGFSLRSPVVPGDTIVDRVIDARVPSFDVGRSNDVLFQRLLGRGLIRRFRHQGHSISIETGCCDFDFGTGQALGHDGKVVDGLYIIGIPTERKHWFTQIGNARPGVVSSFTSEARTIAEGVYTHGMHLLEESVMVS